MAKIDPKSLFLIDGSSLLYRSYYGLHPLQTSTGIPTQAVYGFCRALKKIIDDFNPQYLAVVWDSKGKTFRHDMYEPYKITRQAPPNDLFEQKQYITSVCSMIKVRQISQVGYEADDLIAGLVEEHKQHPIVIVGPDKDLYQLLSDRVLILDPFKKEVVTREDFLQKWGFPPERLSLFYALVGDSSDNIPGVGGIGKKTAQELAQQYDSLDALYQNLEHIKQKRVQSALTTYKDDAYLSLKLFCLRYDPCGIPLDDFSFNAHNWSNAQSLFEKLEFRSLIQKSSHVEENVTPPTPNPWRHTIVHTTEGLDQLIQNISTASLCAFDTETDSEHPLQAELVGISCAYNTTEAFYIPLAHKTSNLTLPQLDTAYVLARLKPIFEDATIKKTFHHAKFDQLVLARHHIYVNGIVFDSLIAASLFKEDDWQKLSLKVLSDRYLQEPMPTFKEIVGKHKNFSYVPLEQGAVYAAFDALQTFKLHQVFHTKLAQEKKLLTLFTTLELPFNTILFNMELKGICCDPDILKIVAQNVKEELVTIHEKIKGIMQVVKLKEEFNFNSPQQVGTLLFDVLRLPSVKTSSTTAHRSTDNEVLTELSKIHPIPAMIIKHRELSKLLNTYLEPLPLQINPETKRIHTSYSQTHVITGRLASSEPNLQNIPANNSYGLRIRSAFFAPDSARFLAADYSQIELRILAVLSNDKNLQTIFINDRDIHQETARQIFGVEPEQVTHMQRQIGKRLNFSVIYGITPFGLSKDLGIPVKDAKLYIETFFNQYPGVAAWVEQMVEEGKKQGYVETLFGRRRYVKGLQEKNQLLFQAARRIAINSPVQGTQAEIMKLAMLNLHKTFTDKKLNASLVLQIHDEIVLEVPTDELEIVKAITIQEMENVISWPIPLKVSLKEGRNWGEVTK